MEPTPRAQSIVGPTREVLSRIEREVIAGLAFEPQTSTTTITLALSDVGEMVFLPRILERVQTEAPMAPIRSVTPPPNELRERLENGDIDLAIGYFPDLEKGNFFQQRLFTHHFTCLLREDHPISSARLTLKQFLSLRHVSVRAEGRSQEIFERFLVSKKIRRNIVLFYSALHVLADNYWAVRSGCNGSTRDRHVLLECARRDKGRCAAAARPAEDRAQAALAPQSSPRFAESMASPYRLPTL